MVQAIGQLLPFAVGIAVSPVPIIAVILMLFSQKATSNGPAFVAGWLLGLFVAGIVVLALAGTGGTGTTGNPSPLATVVHLALGLLLLLLGFRQWRGRPREGSQPEMPKWMHAIDSITPIKAIGLGALLSGLNPKNLGLIIAAGVALAQAALPAGQTAIVYAVFALIASVSIAGPVLYYLLARSSAEKTLDGWRTWLTTNNTAVMAVLFLVFGAVLLGKGLTGLD
jgi:threonine/homoserine/homoserine lactone efflux protein